MRFEDRHPAFNASGYACTNEEPEIFAHLLGRKRFEKSGGIASGGEILFSTILPRTKGEVVMVDHSYKALVVCWIKASLLSSLGPRGLKTLFLFGGHEKFMEKVMEIVPSLPPELSVKFAPCMKGNTYSGTFTPNEFPALRKEWFYISEVALRASLKRLDRLTFIHGDLSDLPTNLDLLYVSNATGHTNRDNKYPTYDGVSEHLKVGGTLLSTGSVPTSIFNGPAKLVKEINSMPGFRSSWTHILSEKVGK